MRALYALVGCAALALFAVPPATAGGDAEVRTFIEKFFADYNGGNLAATMAAWRTDGMHINFSGTVSGNAALQERLGNEIKNGVKLEYSIERVAVEGVSAWATGPYTVTIPSKEGPSTQRHGAWLQLLKRESGHWKIQTASFTRFESPK
jgi:ketosteroid isomerase-like protein